MIHLKTKTAFPIPTKRGVINGIIYFIIDKAEVDINNITAKGYYYYKDDNGSVVILDHVTHLKQWDFVKEVEENILNPLESSVSVKANILQRLEEFVQLTLTQEAGENYGTVVEDWEKVI